MPVGALVSANMIILSFWVCMEDIYIETGNEVVVGDMVKVYINGCSVCIYYILSIWRRIRETEGLH